MGAKVPPAVPYTASVTLADVRCGIARLPAGRRRVLVGAAADEVFGTFADRVLPFDAAAASYAQHRRLPSVGPGSRESLAHRHLMTTSSLSEAELVPFQVGHLDRAVFAVATAGRP